MATYGASLGVLAGMLDTLTVDHDRMRIAAAEGYTTATAVADALVRRGVPFLAAHHAVGTLVARAEALRVTLDVMPDEDIAVALGNADDGALAALADEGGIGAELRAAASIDGALATCDVIGGTAPGRVEAALQAARSRLDAAP